MSLSAAFVHVWAVFLTIELKTEALLQLWLDRHEQVRSDIQN